MSGGGWRKLEDLILSETVGMGGDVIQCAMCLDVFWASCQETALLHMTAAKTWEQHASQRPASQSP